MRLSLGSVVGPSGSLAHIHDLSVTGLLFETSAPLSEDRVEVQLPEVGPTHARVVWHHGRFFGCNFVQPIPKAAVSAALLRSAPLTNAGETAFPFPVEAAEALGTGSTFGARIRGWWEGAIAAGAALAGAAFLVRTGHTALLLGIAGGLVATVAALAGILDWTLDNTFDPTM